MVEESDKNAASEMTPQEDGTKVLLNEEHAAVTIEEAKYVSNPNGDAKIDVEVPPAFSGLTKEELMKYSDDPFWVRLRWFLFILFWLGWAAMLVMAIIIIIQAPGCKPPPELLWVEEMPMLEIDKMVLPTEKEIMDRCSEMGISSVYFPKLISEKNFQEKNYNVLPLIEALVAAKKKVVTDLPSSIDKSNPFYANATSQNLIRDDGSWNYTNEDLPDAIFKEIVDLWIAKGVKGFLMADADTPEKRGFKAKLNGLAEEKEGAIGSDIIDTKEKVKTPTAFKQFLEDNSVNWNFYEFHPTLAIGSPQIGEHNLRLMTVGLYLTTGTPMLVNYKTISNASSELISSLGKIKIENSIKFGSVNFVNTTDEVIAFTRVFKGTPAYAVALNFNDFNATVSFEGTSNVGDKGTVEISSKTEANNYNSREKIDLNDIYLEPYQGMVLQFIANF